MRTFIFAMLALLDIYSFANADVVFSNLNNTGAGTSALDFSLNFNVTTSGSSITAFKLFSAGDQGSKAVSFQLNSGAVLTQSATFQTDGYLFDLTALAGASSISAGSVQTLALSSIGVTYGTTNASTIANNPNFGFYNTSYVGSASSYARFEVVGVPEPGTLFLGGIAALAGGSGLFWKRRRKVAESLPNNNLHV